VSSFADFKADGYLWITLAKGQFYPDYLTDAVALYAPVIEIFGQLIQTSASSEALFRQIVAIAEPAMRVQLLRVFRKYVSPETPVEMLKAKAKAASIIAQFGHGFGPIHEVQRAFLSRPVPDDVLAAILWEYKERGAKGYSLTTQFFQLFRQHFPALHLAGPERAGADILLHTVFAEYPNPKRPVDFIIYQGEPLTPQTVLAIGLARYDSDRGGAQEDDRIGGYRHCAAEILRYTQAHGLNTKMLFLNDGPGLLLGSM
jgi:hypothetical protein